MRIDTISFMLAGISTSALTLWAVLHNEPVIALGVCSNGLALCLALFRLIKGEQK